MACVTINRVDAVARVLRYCVDDPRVLMRALAYSVSPRAYWIDGREIRAVTVYWDSVGLSSARPLDRITLWDTGFPTIAGSHRSVPIAELPLNISVRDKGILGL